MKLYLQTVSESLIDRMHGHRLCISYDRLRVLSTDIAKFIIGHWQEERAVVPIQPVTTHGLNNIDYIPSSTTVVSSDHGKCISIQQHFVSDM